MFFKNLDHITCPVCKAKQEEGTAQDYVTHDVRSYGVIHTEQCEACDTVLEIKRINEDTVEVHAQ